MHFLYPSMFWWLFALAIPVIVHLFNFRRHKLLYFSNVSLLKSLQQESSKKRNIKHLLILLSRLLFIAAFVFALAQPYRAAETSINPDAENIVSVYIDNSMSMQLPGAELSLVDQSRQIAKQIALQFGLNNRFYLFTNDFLPAHQRSLSLTEFVQEVEQLRAGAPPARLSEVFLRTKTLQYDKAADSRLMFLLTDLQRSGVDVENIEADSSLNLFVVPMEPTIANNIFVDSCWFESPVLHAGLPLNLNIRIGNSGEEDAKSIPLQLEVGGVQAAVTNIDIPANSHLEVSMQFSVNRPGYHPAKLSLLDFPVVFDDELYFSFEIRPEIQLLEVFEDTPNSWLELLFFEDEHIRFSSYSRLQLDIRALESYDLILLNEVEELPSGLTLALEQFVERGGSLVIIPSSKNAEAVKTLAIGYGMDFAAHTDTVKSRVLNVEQQHPLLRDVFVKIPDNPDFPTVFKHYPIRLAAGSLTQPLIHLLNGNPMLLAGQHGKGRVYAMAMPLNTEFSDFTTNSLFVPVFYRMALLSAKTTDLYHISGNEVDIELGNEAIGDAGSMRIKGFENDEELIPAVRQLGGVPQLFIPPQSIPAGHYGLFENDRMLSLVAMNDDRSESVLRYFDEEEIAPLLKEKFKTITFLDSNKIVVDNDLDQMLGAKRWYHYFLILALLFILTEILIIRLWK